MTSKKPEIYLERKFDAYLAEWKSRGDRLPLIIKGARQVGVYVAYEPAHIVLSVPPGGEIW